MQPTLPRLTRVKIALASCAEIPELDDEGQLLVAALRERGAGHDHPGVGRP